jgi:hypothetical protein
MTHFWKKWEGVSLPGDYTLEQWLGGQDNAGIFLTSPAPDGRCGIARLLPEGSAAEVSPLDLWHRTRQLRHPNLMELLDYGRADLAGDIVLYAVFESPDDSLADALSRAPLDRQEAREVLDSLLDALRYLHAQGLVSGALDAGHVVAVGDGIKLSTDALRDADTSSAYGEDVRLLGELWQQALLSASAQSVEIAAHAADPNPQTRWTLAEIGAALNPPVAAAPPAAAPPAGQPPAPPLVVSPPIAAAPPAIRPPVNDAPVRPPSQESVPGSASEPSEAPRVPKWIFVGAAAVVLVVLGLNLPRSADVAAPSRVAPVAPPVPTAPPAPVPKAAAPKTSPAGKEIWRVIAFTYRSRDAAAKKAQQLNEVHPGLNATVFSPEQDRAYYLVSLGGRMTHEDAVRLQHSARGKGLPRDLYVQNYAE